MPERPGRRHQSGLKVLFVTARYPPYTGGTEIHTYEVARRLTARGYRVSVLTTDPQGSLSADEEAAGVRILRVRAWPARGDLYFAPGIFRSIMRDRWDIIHCQGYHTLVAPLAMLGAIRSRTPYIVTFHSGGHSSGLRNAVREFQWKMLGPLFARAQRLVAVSEFESDYFRQRLHLSRERFLVIPNGTSLPETAGLQDINVDGSLIVSIGRLERYKGHQRIIAALPRVLEQRPDIRLRIVGEGSYGLHLLRLARELGVADRVEIGAIASDDRRGMAALLARAALVALLSEYESQGIAIMEALALRRPVLVTATSALMELVERGLARAVPLRSTSAEVAAAILDQLRQPLIPSVVALPTWEGCTASLAALYATIGAR